MAAVGRHRRYATRGLPLRVAGAILLSVSAGIHLDLYLTGYRTIPVIGWLFMLQFIGGFTLAIAVLVTHSRLAVAASAAFALSTLTATPLDLETLAPSHWTYPWAQTMRGSGSPAAGGRRCCWPAPVLTKPIKCLTGLDCQPHRLRPKEARWTATFTSNSPCTPPSRNPGGARHRTKLVIGSSPETGSWEAGALAFVGCGRAP